MLPLAGLLLAVSLGRFALVTLGVVSNYELSEGAVPSRVVTAKCSIDISCLSLQRSGTEGHVSSRAASGGYCSLARLLGP